MKIEHIAIWCENLERMKLFYQKYFNASSNSKYVNETRGFSSYFLTLPEGARIELMKMDSIDVLPVEAYKQFTGLAHIAFKADSAEKVDNMTQAFIADGFEILNGPRWTGDGYYESVLLDPEGNHLEIVA
ncbi:VOC family protein [Vibrio sp. JC009]|uniref:VOC family protein n=1 Tax=Vibrio sp. JC009 TaxID=2912314 RepID=UPI0023AE6DDB|nr:VOC family protein [Vibrio sp. JC009]WED24312.1 VOC family protein [Vibrio sp. JC009]